MLTPLVLQSAIVFKLGVEQVSICFRVCARQDALDNLQDAKSKLEKIGKFKKIDGDNVTYGSGVLFSMTSEFMTETTLLRSPSHES